MPAQLNVVPTAFQPLGARRVEVDFSAGHITSDAGGLLLRELETSTRVVERLARCFVDHRDPEAIEFSVQELVGQRLYGLALGYEDLNDHDTLRLDPMLATLVGRLDPSGQSRQRARDKGKPLAGKSTLNRLELTPAGTGDDRYKRIVYLPYAMDQLLVELFTENAGARPEEIVLDFDTTNDPTHGNQEGRFFHGYYDQYCYLPLYVFCGHDLLLARLLTADTDPAAAALKELPGLVARIRRYWPEVRIIVRGDSAFSTEPVMRWCEDHKLFYVLGLAQNPRLLKCLKSSTDKAEARFKAQEGPVKSAVRVFQDFTYCTLETWSRRRRVIGKAEHLPGGPNPRFIVTNLPKPTWEGQFLYERLYCARGNMENRIKEQQLGMFADRTSTHTLRANQLRLLFSSFAYVLVNLLRRLVLTGTKLETAQVGTIRLRLFKIGALVRVTVRRVWVQMSSAHPAQALFHELIERVRQLRPRAA